MVLVKWISSAFSKKPKTAEVVSSFFLTYLSDMICQYIEKPKNKSYAESYESRRSCNLSFFRAGCITPILHYWYKHLNAVWPSRTLTSVFFKSMFDRMTIGAFTVVGFFVSQHYLNGGNTEDLKVKLEKDLPKALKMNVAFWTAGLMINFKLVPCNHQVLFINKIAFFWMIYLSLAMNKGSDESLTEKLNEQILERSQVACIVKEEYEQNYTFNLP